MLPLGNPSFQNDLFVRVWRFFTPIMGYLANAAMGSSRRFSAGHKMRRVLCFLGILVVSGFWGEVFISNKIERDKEPVGFFGFVLLFFACPFFLLPNPQVECLALMGEAGGEGFFLFVWHFLWYLWFYISLVYRNLRVILLENSPDDILARGRSTVCFAAHSRHWVGEMPNGQNLRTPFSGRIQEIIWINYLLAINCFALAFESILP